MKTFRKLFVGFLLILGAASVSGAIRWEVTSIERELPVGESMISAVFAFENTGTRPVQISQVRTNCGCTAGNHSRGAIEPGERGEVTLLFNATGRRGLQRNRATVELDVGGRREQQTLEFAVSIPQLIAAIPQVIQWPAASGEPRAERLVRINLDTRFDPKVSKVEYNDALLSVRQVRDPKKPGEVLLYIQPLGEGDLAPGRSQIQVTAQTADEREQAVSIFVLIR